MLRAVLALTVLVAQLSWTPMRPASPSRAPPPAGEHARAEGDSETPAVVEPRDDEGAWRRVLRADSTAGWTSNALQIASEDGQSVFANRALVGALQLTGQMTQQRGAGGSLQLDMSALVLRNIAMDGAVPPSEGSGSIRAQHMQFLSPRTQGIVAIGGSIGTLNARRATDPRMAAIDPTSVDRTYASSALEIAWLYALAPETRIGLGGTVTGLFTLHDQDVSLGAGQTLRHRGLDQLLVNAELGLDRDVSQRLRAEGLLRVLHVEQPFVLDLSTGVPKNIGPFRTQVLTGLLGAGYVFSERLQGDARVGISAATPLPDDLDKTPYVEPAALLRGAYDDERRRVSILVSYQYSAAIPRLGAGPSLTILATAFGIPYDHGVWRALNLLATGSVDRTIARTGAASSLEVRTASVSCAARYSLGRNLGILAGADVRAARFDGRGMVPAPYDRTLIFFGISWFESNGRDERTLMPFGDMPL